MLVVMVRRGTVGGDTKVWVAGMVEWAPLAEVLGVGTRSFASRRDELNLAGLAMIVDTALARRGDGGMPLVVSVDSPGSGLARPAAVCAAPAHYCLPLLWRCQLSHSKTNEKVCTRCVTNCVCRRLPR